MKQQRHLLGSELDEISSLRDRGLTGQYVAAARKLAATHPNEVLARIEAASACESVGEEELAIEHYDAAWSLGVPASNYPAFCAAYGATLSSVGRVDESVAILAESMERCPDYAPIKAFLALALHKARHHNAAMATLLQLILEMTTGDELDGFDAALAQSQTELVAATLEQP